MTKQTLYLVDGYNIIFRAFHSLPPLTRSDGTPIGAVYGFINMMLKLLREDMSLDGNKIAVVLDSGKDNKRHKLYPAYKAHRPEVDQALIPQFTIVREAIEALNLPLIIAEDGYEADDMIATYALHAKEAGLNVVIFSTDKDLMQLVCNEITMYDGNKGAVIDAEYVQHKFGTSPKNVIDFLALVGDSSDNIPGGAGIGTKTAISIISNYGSIDEIYSNIENVEPAKHQALLLKSKANILLSKELVQLMFDAPMMQPLEALLYKKYDEAKLYTFLTQNEFSNIIKRIWPNGYISGNVEASKHLTLPELIIEHKDITLIPLEYLLNSTIVFIIIRDDYLYIATEHEIYKTEYTHTRSSLFTDASNAKAVWSYFAPLLESRQVVKLILEGKELKRTWNAFGINIACVDELLTIAYTTRTGHKDIKYAELTEHYCHISVHNIELSNAPIEAKTAIQLYKSLYHNLIMDKNVTLYERIDKPLDDIVLKMEEKGIIADAVYINELLAEFSTKLDSLQAAIFSMTGEAFNLGSPKQLGEILFDKLHLPTKQSGKGRSTDASILESLYEAGYDVAGLVLEWRKYSKLIGTYLNGLLAAINKTTGRIHTTFHTKATSTARFASSHPNLQNIPIHSEDGAKIRKAFIAAPGHCILSADYSQIELRLLAHIADIPALQQAFKDSIDVHAFTASAVLNKPIAGITNEDRRMAKAINFGIIYGMGAFSLAKRLGITQKEAQAYINSYMARYSGIEAYMAKTIEYAKKHKFVKTIFGRKCDVYGGENTNYNDKGAAGRAAINAPMQGSASDIIRKAIVSLPEYLKQHLILQIHDELLFELPNELVDSASKDIKLAMEGVVKLKVPLIVSIKHGKSWFDAHL